MDLGIYWFSLLKFLIVVVSCIFVWLLASKGRKKSAIALSVFAVLIFLYQPVKLVHMETSEREIRSFDKEVVQDVEIQRHSVETYRPDDNEEKINEILGEN